ncbi:MAG: prolyl oligopeptidase family serine peptidase [Chitinophagaceae bacterium]
MFRLTLIISFVILFNICIGQEVSKSNDNLIDSGVIKSWTYLHPVSSISNDGNYVVYTIVNSSRGKNTLVFQSVKGEWKKEIENGLVRYPNFFSSDSRYGFFTCGDSLFMTRLGTNALEFMGTVASYKNPENRRSNWFAYQKKNEQKQLIVLDIKTGKKKEFNEVSNYYFNKDGNNLFVVIKKKNEDGNFLYVFDLKANAVRGIWDDGIILNLTFSEKGDKIAFVSRPVPGNSETAIHRSIWFYDTGDKYASKIFDTTYPIALQNVNFRIEKFGFKDEVFFTVQKKVTQSGGDNVKVDVWSHSDEKLQSEQLTELSKTRSLLYAVKIKDGSLIQVEEDNDTKISKDLSNRFFLLKHQTGKANLVERNWNSAAHISYFLFDIKSKKRKLLSIPDEVRGDLILSLDGRYIIYFNASDRNYWCLEASTNKVRNLTQNIPAKWYLIGSEQVPDPLFLPYEIGGWIKDDSSILLYDQYDIWKIDPAAETPPSCLTGTHGKNLHTTFRLINSNPETFFSVTNEVLLSAFNQKTKQNGFYKTILNGKGKLEKLIFTDHAYSFLPIKAQNANAWLVRRENAEESPNYFFTSNFNRLHQLSNVYPERNYRWLNSSLFNFTVDNDTLQCVIYKPADFDSTKQYPLIISVYEELSQNLHKFPKPEFSWGEINIPWFVSRGYIVITPDIHYINGYPGKSALNAATAAANYASQYPWINKEKMAITGHSFGGYETNYIVSHNNHFAAAFSSSGYCDFVSGYGAVAPGPGHSLQSFYEQGQNRIGSSLWEKPELFIDNSPIFKADNVTTPLLMMNNKGDGVVPFAQGVEFFTALRRLGKRVWMLQYDGEAHVVSDEAAQLDLTFRVTEFFDHFLKDRPAPLWMTKGISADKKTVETGHSLDPAGKCSGHCGVCDQWNKKFLRSPEMFYKPATEWILNNQK